MADSSRFNKEMDIKIDDRFNREMDKEIYSVSLSEVHLCWIELNSSSSESYIQGTIWVTSMKEMNIIETLTITIEKKEIEFIILSLSHIKSIENYKHAYYYVIHISQKAISLKRPSTTLFVEKNLEAIVKTIWPSCAVSATEAESFQMCWEESFLNFITRLCNKYCLHFFFDYKGKLHIGLKEALMGKKIEVVNYYKTQNVYVEELNLGHLGNSKLNHHSSEKAKTHWGYYQSKDLSGMLKFNNKSKSIISARIIVELKKHELPQLWDYCQIEGNKYFLSQWSFVGGTVSLTFHDIPPIPSAFYPKPPLLEACISEWVWGGNKVRCYFLSEPKKIFEASLAQFLANKSYSACFTLSPNARVLIDFLDEQLTYPVVRYSLYPDYNKDFQSPWKEKEMGMTISDQYSLKWKNLTSGPIEIDETTVGDRIEKITNLSTTAEKKIYIKADEIVIEAKTFKFTAEKSTIQSKETEITGTSSKSTIDEVEITTKSTEFTTKKMKFKADETKLESDKMEMEIKESKSAIKEVKDTITKAELKFDSLKVKADSFDGNITEGNIKAIKLASNVTELSSTIMQADLKIQLLTFAASLATLSLDMASVSGMVVGLPYIPLP